MSVKVRQGYSRINEDVLYRNVFSLTSSVISVIVLPTLRCGAFF